MKRIDNRRFDELRPVRITPNYVIYPEGSILISMGNTRVLCNVSVESSIPNWMKASGKSGGWITAEYSLLPRSTGIRTKRETSGLRGRTQEIRRLIGRALRAGFDLGKLGEHTCIVDCDVIQADGGTRTAAITGGYLAVWLALKEMVDTGILSESVFLDPIAAVSVGVVEGEPLLDLNYREDSAADVDMNLVMNVRGDFIEVQGSAEGAPFSREMLETLLRFGSKGITDLIEIQKHFMERQGLV